MKNNNINLQKHGFLADIVRFPDTWGAAPDCVDTTGCRTNHGSRVRSEKWRAPASRCGSDTLFIPPNELDLNDLRPHLPAPSRRRDQQPRPPGAAGRSQGG